MERIKDCLKRLVEIKREEAEILEEINAQLEDDDEQDIDEEHIDEDIWEDDDDL